MANYEGYALGIKDKNGKIYGLKKEAIEGLENMGGSAEGVGINESGNLEISSVGLTGATKGKVNIVSQNDIQVKLGTDGTLQLDSEFDTASPYEYSVKTCNGAIADKKNRVTGLKVNAAGLVLDTQNACSVANDEAGFKGYDKTEFEIKFRQDKWNSGVPTDAMGPTYAKLKARAFDVRCYGHGGIALQIAGEDNSGHENKIKFESDRTSGIGEAERYCGEGGKGVEFGTFNTEKASLYVGEYRFKGDSKVYGVTRGDLVASSTGKIDYPKQSDDFADIVDANNGATWNEIIAVAKAHKAGQLGGVSEDFVKAEIAKAALEGGDVDMSVFVTREEVEDIVDSAMTEYDVDLTGYATESYVNTKVSNEVNGVKEAMAPAVDHIAYTELKDGVVKGLDIKLDEIRNQDALDAYAVAKEAYDKYVADKAVYDALTDEEKALVEAPAEVANPALVEPEYRSLNIANPNGKLAIKTADISMETPNIVIPFEISKKGKFTMGGVDVEGVLASKTATVDDLIPYIKEGVKIAIRTEKNNAPSAALAAAYPEGSDLISVSVYDLLALVDKVAALESKITTLEAKMELYHPTVNSPADAEPVEEEPQA